jgi:hypothetical protein
MADNNGSGVGTGLIAGILIVVLIAVGLVVMNGGLNLQGDKDVNVTVQPPKIDAPATGGDKSG